MNNFPVRRDWWKGIEGEGANDCQTRTFSQKRALFLGATGAKFSAMSTVAEIESAIEELPAGELHRLLDRLFAKSANSLAKPKTGAELAKLWSARFHLPTSEAEAFAADLAETRAKQPVVRPSTWE